MGQTADRLDGTLHHAALEGKVEEILEQMAFLARMVSDLSDRCDGFQRRMLSRMAAISGTSWIRPVYHPRGVHETPEELIDCPECFPPLARALAKRPEKIREIQEVYGEEG